MKILKRDYDVAVNKIKGIEILESEYMEDTHKGKLSRFIVVLDETGYSINADGEPEMTEDAQREYDEFVTQIRKKMDREEIRILDEGYGTGEDELEWHITACVIDDMGGILGDILEIDVCVRTDEDSVDFC